MNPPTTLPVSTPQELFRACAAAPDGATIALSPGARFDVWSDDCPVMDGYHLSNTAGLAENPLGRRPVCMYMKGKRHITIEGNGASVIIHGVITPILFDGCEDLTLRNFTVDYAHPTMSEFTIEEALGDGRFRIRIAPDTLYDLTDTPSGRRILWHSERGQGGEYLWQCDYRDDMVLSMRKDPATEFTQMMGVDADTVRFPIIPLFSEIERDEADERVLIVKLKNPEAYFPVGCTVQSRHTMRDQVGGAFVCCRRVTCQNLTIRAMHGLGLLGQNCEDITYDGLDITPAPGRTVASNADFFHFAGCSGRITIQNCTASDGHDDFVNAHGIHLKVIEAEGTRLRVRFMHVASRGFAAVFPGDEIDFIDRETLLPYGTATVCTATLVSDTDHIIELTAPADVRVGDVIENATRTPALHIHHNRFGPFTGRGILCTTRRPVLIENNVFYKTGGNVLCIEDDCNFWYESGYTTDVTFRDNDIIECGYGSLGRGAVPVISVNPQVLRPTTTGKDGSESPVYVHDRIAVTGNRFRFTDRVSATVEVKYTRHFLFKDNICDRAPVFEMTGVACAETDGSSILKPKKGHNS